MIAIILFWISVAVVFHSYLLFPVSLLVIRRIRKNKINSDLLPSPVPVSLVISAFNEESVIEEKIQSILSSAYPKKLIEIIIGSDASTDQTNEIVQRLTKEYPGTIRFFPFEDRQGKPNVVNHLIKEVTHDIIILTDANVMFDKDTLVQITQPFSDPKVGLVDTQMINMGLKRGGISYQEKAYISREVKIKHLESEIWGTMMGPFGGCYAIRKSLYQEVPSNFLVDDFYLNMQVLKAGYLAINNPLARVFEDVSNNLDIEFRRKVRIGTGNFQNLTKFGSLLWKKRSGLAYCFISHKILRWLGPIFLLMALISLIFLANNSTLYQNLLAIYLVVLILPIIDILLKKLNLHIPILRFLTHFLAMNLAMGFGLIKYLKGVRSNVWQPTKRHQ